MSKALEAILLLVNSFLYALYVHDYFVKKKYI